MQDWWYVSVVYGNGELRTNLWVRGRDAAEKVLADWRETRTEKSWGEHEDVRPLLTIEGVCDDAPRSPTKVVFEVDVVRAIFVSEGFSRE